MGHALVQRRRGVRLIAAHVAAVVVALAPSFALAWPSGRSSGSSRLCAVGRFADVRLVNSVHWSVCLRCPAGKYSLSSGQRNCTACPPHSAAPVQQCSPHYAAIAEHKRLAALTAKLNRLKAIRQNPIFRWIQSSHETVSTRGPTPRPSSQPRRVRAATPTPTTTPTPVPSLRPTPSPTPTCPGGMCWRGTSCHLQEDCEATPPPSPTLESCADIGEKCDLSPPYCCASQTCQEFFGERRCAAAHPANISRPTAIPTVIPTTAPTVAPTFSHPTPIATMKPFIEGGGTVFPTNVKKRLNQSSQQFHSALVQRPNQMRGNCPASMCWMQGVCHLEKDCAAWAAKTYSTGHKCPPSLSAADCASWLLQFPTPAPWKGN